jgi:hypothetical protein
LFALASSFSSNHVSFFFLRSRCFGRLVINRRDSKSNARLRYCSLLRWTGWVVCWIIEEEPLSNPRRIIYKFGSSSSWVLR